MSNTPQTFSDTIIQNRFSRIIGRFTGEMEGPVVIVFAGMHGNEPSGIKALEELFEGLEPLKPHFRGKVIGILANIRATYEGVRFIDEDMNRIWFPSIIDKILRCPVEELESSERAEIKELLHIVDREVRDNEEHPVVFVDIHSFSAEGCMFAITAREEKNIKLVSSLHTPMIFGIDETLRGTALRYFQEHDFISFALEGGNHQSKLTVYNNLAALNLLLVNSGCIDKSDMPEFKNYENHLRDRTKHLPPKVELVYQHIIEPGDEFEMRSGFKNFQAVKKGEWVANDKNGKIRTQCDGYILMPLYQKQGDDGFFIVQEPT